MSKLADYFRDQVHWHQGGPGLEALAYYVDRLPTDGAAADDRPGVLEAYLDEHGGLVGADVREKLNAYNPDPGDGDDPHDKFLKELAAAVKKQPASKKK